MPLIEGSNELGGTEEVNVRGKALAVGDGVSGVLKSRRLDAMLLTHPGADVAGVNSNAMTFSEAENARKITITIQGNAAVSDNQQYCDVVVDAPNGTVAKAFLVALNAGNVTNTAFITMRVLFGVKTELPISTSPIRRVDFLPTQLARALAEVI